MQKLSKMKKKIVHIIGYVSKFQPPPPSKHYLESSNNLSLCFKEWSPTTFPLKPLLYSEIFHGNI